MEDILSKSASVISYLNYYTSFDSLIQILLAMSMIVVP